MWPTWEYCGLGAGPCLVLPSHDRSYPWSESVEFEVSSSGAAKLRSVALASCWRMAAAMAYSAKKFWDSRILAVILPIAVKWITGVCVVYLIVIRLGNFISTAGKLIKKISKVRIYHNLMFFIGWAKETSCLRGIHGFCRNEARFLSHPLYLDKCVRGQTNLFSHGILMSHCVRIELHRLVGLSVVDPL